MTPITLSSSTLVDTTRRNPDTLNVAYRDDDRKNERMFVGEHTPLRLSVPSSEGTRCHGAREQGRRWRDFREEKESALQISSRGDEGDRERERESS